MKVKELLVEYLVKPGQPIREVLSLNLFGDMDEKLSKYDDEFTDARWVAIERKYSKVANKLKSLILQSRNTYLTAEDVDAIHSVWYDGSDAYEDVEEAISYLPEVYDSQIEVVRNILGV